MNLRWIFEMISNGFRMYFTMMSEIIPKNFSQGFLKDFQEIHKHPEEFMIIFHNNSRAMSKRTTKRILEKF